jgi:hypothetical protein
MNRTDTLDRKMFVKINQRKFAEGPLLEMNKKVQINFCNTC